MLLLLLQLSLRARGFQMSQVTPQQTGHAYYNMPHIMADWHGGKTRVLSNLCAKL